VAVAPDNGITCPLVASDRLGPASTFGGVLVETVTVNVLVSSASTVPSFTVSVSITGPAGALSATVIVGLSDVASSKVTAPIGDTVQA
jgi:hypothetical protein